MRLLEWSRREEHERRESSFFDPPKRRSVILPQERRAGGLYPSARSQNAYNYCDFGLLEFMCAFNLGVNVRARNLQPKSTCHLTHEPENLQQLSEPWRSAGKNSEASDMVRGDYNLKQLGQTPY